jgi:hypothetical protein
MAVTATEMVRILTEALAKNVGVAEVDIDGQTVRYDRASLIKELTFWEKRAGEQSGKRPLFRGVDLSDAW